MVSLEYLPYYWKLSNHMWQLYTSGMGKFFDMLKFDLSSLPRSHDQKIAAEAYNFTHMFMLSKARADQILGAI